MAIVVTPMTEADVDGAVDCVQKAFADDPYNRWVFNRRENFSIARNKVSLGIRCRWGMKHAIFHVAKDPASDNPNLVLGVACWLPPAKASAPQTWSSYLGEWGLWINQIRMNLTYGRGGLNVQRYYIWKASQAEAQSELWTDEEGYYFCNIVTVLPDAQGRGIGKTLFGVVTDRADEEGRPCYLESSRAEPNMAIYRKMGFELVKTMECDDQGDAITLYCMTREPRKSAI